jgi:glutamyl-tRNA synthetase
LVDENQAKLSKRNQDLALDVSSMRDKQGVLPYTLNNFLALLGWSSPTRHEVMDMEMLIENFDLKFTRGNAQVDVLKLGYLQHFHAKARLEHVYATGDLTPILDIVTAITEEVRTQFAEPICNGEMTYAEYHHVLPDRLAAYCTDIFAIYKHGFKDAASFVQDHRSFFLREPIDIPHKNGMFHGYSPQYYGVPIQMLDTLARDLANDLDWGTAIPPPASASDRVFAVRRLSRTLYKHISQCVWSAVLGDMPMVVLDDAPRPPDAGTCPIHPEAKRAVLQNIPVTMEGTTELCYTLALRLLSHADGDLLTKDDLDQVRNLASVLEWRRKNLSGVIFSYLRMKLSNRTDGPGVHAIMAVLGEDECRARLMVPTKVT